jgi:hypothetical protein
VSNPEAGEVLLNRGRQAGKYDFSHREDFNDFSQFDDCADR